MTDLLDCVAGPEQPLSMGSVAHLPHLAPVWTQEAITPHFLSNVYGQVAHLLDRAQAATMLVCINEWPHVQRLWRGWQPELREILQAIRLCEAARPGLAQHLQCQGRSLAAHLDLLGPVVCQLDVTLMECEADWSWPEALMFSEILENRFIRWLEQLLDFLAFLDENAAF